MWLFKQILASFWQLKDNVFVTCFCLFCFLTKFYRVYIDLWFADFFLHAVFSSWLQTWTLPAFIFIWNCKCQKWNANLYTGPCYLITEQFTLLSTMAIYNKTRSSKGGFGVARYTASFQLISARDRNLQQPLCIQKIIPFPLWPMVAN